MEKALSDPLGVSGVSLQGCPDSPPKRGKNIADTNDSLGDVGGTRRPRPRAGHHEPSHPKGHGGHVTFQRTYRVKYLGQMVLDCRFTQPMLPWIILEVKRDSPLQAVDIFVEVTDSSLKGMAIKDYSVIFEHQLQKISKFVKSSQDHRCFSYLTRGNPDASVTCHVFQATDENSVLELFTTMREMTKEMGHTQCTLSQLGKAYSTGNLDALLCSTQQFEVMYVGKIKVSHKRAPPSFIDEAVDKFHAYELEKVRSQVSERLLQPSLPLRFRHGSGGSLPPHFDETDMAKENDLMLQAKHLPSNSNLSNSSSEQSSCENISESAADPLKANSPGLEESKGNFSLPNSPGGSTEKLTGTPVSLITHTQSMDSATRATIMQDLHECASQSTTLYPLDNLLGAHSQNFQTLSQNDSKDVSGRIRSCSGDVPRPSKQASLPVYRTRIGSGGSADIRRTRSNTTLATPSTQSSNRTMLFLIGKFELCLISTDRKQMLLSKAFSDISHCSQGVKNSDNFGFISRDTTASAADAYVGYVFRCQTEGVVDEIMQSLKQAFHSAHQTYQQQHQTAATSAITMCESCPMHWFHRLCVDIEGIIPERSQLIILQRIESLPSNDREAIMLKWKDEDSDSIAEQNEFFMIMLRRMCEHKQKVHQHSSHKHEPWHHDRKGSSSTFDNLRLMAKRSLSNSFETILKRKGKEEGRGRSATMDSDKTLQHKLLYIDGSHEDTSPSSGEESHSSSSSVFTFDKGDSLPAQTQRPRSSTISTVGEIHKQSIRKSKSDPYAKSPMMNIFMKVGNQKRNAAKQDVPEGMKAQKGPWRQLIFNKVQTTIQEGAASSTYLQGKPGDLPSVGQGNYCVRRTREELRMLWKKAIMDQIVLIRMEKENRTLQANQDAATHKRMKLNYEDISPCLKDVAQQWDDLLNDSTGSVFKMNMATLQELVKAGVPRLKRGDIWQLLAEFHDSRNHTIIECENVDLTVPYRELLRQLTPHQHSILIDLGRTFPSHPYYSQRLGSGQLALFNLLKAYSLLDTEVGYCQGLSFLAGVLLLHMSEDQAFHLMKHILFNLGFRGQYKPDMVALQIQMYQLSRLIYDRCRELHDHFEQYDIGPTLYAAPWFLTLFASQFPLGFVARLFDLIFLQGMDAVYKVALILLADHRDLLLCCQGFEPIMEFLKNTLPMIGVIQMERVFSQVFHMDIAKQLQIYEVEYHVLQEEKTHAIMITKENEVPQPEIQMKTLQAGNMELVGQLQVAQTTIHNLEASVASYQNTVKHLESRVRSLEEERESLLNSVKILRNRVERLQDEAQHCAATATLPTLNSSLQDTHSLVDNLQNGSVDHEKQDCPGEEEKNGSAALQDCDRNGNSVSKD